MCGIFGFSGNNPSNNKLKILALYNQARGVHATGIYSDKSGVIKDKVSSDIFIVKYNKKFKANNLLFGHTRYKTHGENTVVNAHPFNFGRVVGVHNGVIENYAEIAQQYNQVVNVDSECIFLAIENNITNEDIILPEIIGAIAIAYTKSDNLLYLYRRENPIFIGNTKDGIYFSSIEDSLSAIDCYNIHSLDEHYIYVYQDGILINEIKVNKPKYSTKINWDDYFLDNNEKMSFTFDELASFGLNLEEISMIINLPYSEQEKYLYEFDYLSDFI